MTTDDFPTPMKSGLALTHPVFVSGPFWPSHSPVAHLSATSNFRLLVASGHSGPASKHQTKFQQQTAEQAGNQWWKTITCTSRQLELFCATRWQSLTCLVCSSDRSLKKRGERTHTRYVCESSPVSFTEPQNGPGTHARKRFSHRLESVSSHTLCF